MVLIAKAIREEGPPGLRHEPWAIPAARPFGTGCWLDGWRRVRKPDLQPGPRITVALPAGEEVLDTVFSREVPVVIDFITSH
jgi:hypothetical protein